MKLLTLIIVFILGVLTGSYHKSKELDIKTLGALTGSYYKPKECKSPTDYNNSIEGSIKNRSIYQYSYR